MSEISVGIVLLAPPAAPPLPCGAHAEAIAYERLLDRELAGHETHFDVVVVDARGVCAENGTELLGDAVRRLQACDAHPLVLVLLDESGTGLGACAVEAGARDILYANELAQLPARLEAAARVIELRGHASLSRIEAEAGADEPGDDEPLQMVGTSEPMQRVFSLIRRVSAFDVPVLLTGESGTGKELAAIAIHERSARSGGPLVTINCGAIPETLLESELFGHEKGAFTGATQSRKGRFEAADRGTIFLDEVGDLAPALQVKLLRFLQDHVVERVGGRGGIALDVRVLAATNRDLQEMVQAGGFREDLFFRLAVLTIEMPPLRERGEDIALMARYFLRRYARESKQPVRSFTREALEAIRQHAWPGNVRELINRVRRATVVAEGSLITPGDLGLATAGHVTTVATLREARRRAELDSLRSALERAGGNKVEAARLLGISRTQLYELLGRHRIAQPHTHTWT
jgi:DNA-binding NtrC family response regulator